MIPESQEAALSTPRYGMNERGKQAPILLFPASGSLSLEARLFCAQPGESPLSTVILLCAVTPALCGLIPLFKDHWCQTQSVHQRGDNSRITGQEGRQPSEPALRSQRVTFTGQSNRRPTLPGEAPCWKPSGQGWFHTQEKQILLLLLRRGARRQRGSARKPQTLSQEKTQAQLHVAPTF